MAKLFSILIFTVILSGCGINQTRLDLSTPTSTPETTTEIITQLKTETSVPEDIDTLGSFEQDNDNDFGAEFSQLESDLQ